METEGDAIFTDATLACMQYFSFVKLKESENSVEIPEKRRFKDMPYH